MTCEICILNLIFLGICGGVFAFSGFNLLLFLCLNSTVALRCVLAVDFVSALFTVYALLAFRPFKGLK